MVEVTLDEVASAALIEEAREAARNAHAPYSNFAVGAAILLSDGTIVRGTNFENASYGLSLCGETVAMAAANAAGRFRDIVALGVIGGVIEPGGTIGGDAVVRPCGRCRQILNESAQLSGRDIVVHCSSADGSRRERHLVSELLPFAFGPADVGIATAVSEAPAAKPLPRIVAETPAPGRGWKLGGARE